MGPRLVWGLPDLLQEGTTNERLEGRVGVGPVPPDAVLQTRTVALCCGNQQSRSIITSPETVRKSVEDFEMGRNPGYSGQLTLSLSLRHFTPL